MTAPSSNLWLKLKTRRLIEACGGLDEASRACAEGCRPYSVPHLSRCQNPATPDLAPIDVVACLEAYCGQPIVSRALMEARPDAPAVGDVRDEATEVTESAASLQRRIREALANDGVIDRREAGEIARAVEEAMGELRDVAACLAGIVAGGAK